MANDKRKEEDLFEAKKQFEKLPEEDKEAMQLKKTLEHEGGGKALEAEKKAERKMKNAREEESSDGDQRIN